MTHAKRPFRSCLWLLLLLPGFACALDAPLRVVTDNNYPPYVFVDEDGEVQGYVVDLWRLWERKTGEKVEFRAIQWSAAQRALLDGDADVIDMIFRTPVREQLYDFSEPYATLPVGIYVDAAISGIHDVESMRGFSVAVQRGDACIDRLAELGFDNYVAYPNYEAMLAAARLGEVRLFCMDEEPANYYLYLHRDGLSFSKAFTLYSGRFHWAVAHGDHATFARVSAGMALIGEDERRALREKWFKHPVQFQPYLRMLGLAALVAAAVLLAALAWIGLLRRVVHARTAALWQANQQLEAASQALRVEQAHLRTLIRNSPDAMAFKDLQGRYLECNPVMERLLGLPRERILGRSDAELFSDEAFVAFVRDNDQEVLQSLQPIRVEQELDAADGVHRTIEVIKVAIRDADGQPTGLLAVARDISERKRAERELRIASAAFESHDGIMITDAKGVIERVNAAFSRMSGYAAEDAVGRSPRILESGVHPPEFFAEMWSLLRQDGYWSGEVVNRHPAGQLYTVRLSITRVSDERGTPMRYIGHLQDITSERLAQARLEHLRLFDALTDLPNRQLLNDRIVRATAESEASRSHCALLMLDLDLFRRINDSLGHGVGDQLIVEMAARIRAHLREADTLCRFSGDTFVVLLERLAEDRQAALARASQVAEGLRRCVAEPVELAGNRLLCTCSIGVTLFQCRTASVDALVPQAELAMFGSKKAGRNTVRFFQEEMQREFDRRNQLEAELRDAIAADRLVLFYQVQVDAAGRPLGAEALVRWQHPQRGWIAPVEFIPLAEETGLIQPLGHAVLRQACATLARWFDDPALAPLVLAVNVSTIQFQGEHFVEDVLGLLRETGVSPARLKIEVTESVAIDDYAGSIETLARLRASGIAISIDDFGTGNSSLVYLTKLPASQLKIDKSFVDELPDNPRDALVAQAVIALGQGLDLDVIAEGVETDAQFDHLVALGCRAFQGYRFGRPMPAADFEAAVRAMAAAGAER